MKNEQLRVGLLYNYIWRYNISMCCLSMVLYIIIGYYSVVVTYNGAISINSQLMGVFNVCCLVCGTLACERCEYFHLLVFHDC